MPTHQQIHAARQNIRKAQHTWKSMTHLERALAQPEGLARIKPEEKETGEFYRIVLRPKEEFVAFRIQDVGRQGHAERLAGKRPNGRGDTQAWLINKNDAHIDDGELVPDDPSAKRILDKLQTKPFHVAGDIFVAKDRKDVPEREKPSVAQKTAQQKNIRKARAARRSK